MNNDLLILVKDLNDGINLFKTYVDDWNNMINDKDSLYNTLNYDLKRFLFNSYCNKIKNKIGLQLFLILEDLYSEYFYI
jgi:hypothetical protein